MAKQLFHSTGKRKTAVARVWMRPGEGDITINKRPLDTYFCRDSDRGVVLAPLEATGMRDKFTTRINVSGGGGAFPGRPGPCDTDSAGPW